MQEEGQAHTDLHQCLDPEDASAHRLADVHGRRRVDMEDVLAEEEEVEGVDIEAAVLEVMATTHGPGPALDLLGAVVPDRIRHVRRQDLRGEEDVAEDIVDGIRRPEEEVVVVVEDDEARAIALTIATVTAAGAGAADQEAETGDRNPSPLG
jgi:hypothetical protein